MTDFQYWLNAEIDERADGSPVAYARIIGMSDSAVIAWVQGAARPSVKGCKALGRVTGLPWRVIGQMAGSRYVGGVGNGLHEIDRDPEPLEELVSVDDEVIFEPAFPKCDGCDRYKHNTGAYANREEFYCRTMVDVGLPPLCYGWGDPDLRQLERFILLEDGETIPHVRR